MKRGVIVIAALISGVILAYLIIAGLHNPLKGLSISNITPLPTNSPTPTPKVLRPTEIKIPKWGIDARIEAVTVDKDGNMDVPKDYMDTAWYSHGPRPGEMGNAVIDGHVDTPTGAPAVFANIGKLTRGDIVEIKAEDGNTLTFFVEKVETYPIESIPLDKIFDKTTREKRLNLITCGGVWDKSKKMYSERTVVYSKTN